MFNKTLKSLLSKSTLLALGFGIFAVGSTPLVASSSNNGVTPQQRITPEMGFQDGMYLYGESSNPEVIGQEYLVFQVNQERVVGAVYLPRSEFSCFYGTLSPQQMSLTVLDPYDQTPYSYPIALHNSSLIAASNGSASRSSVELEGYQRLENISDNDLRMLETCQNQFQN